MKDQNPESRYVGPTILFGRAILTPHTEILNLVTNHSTLGEAAANHISDEAELHDKRFANLAPEQQVRAGGLLKAGIDDVRSVTLPYLDRADLVASADFARHSDTIATIAQLAQNNERRMRAYIKFNRGASSMYGRYVEGGGLTMKPGQYIGGDGCPFAGEQLTETTSALEPRPLFVKFTRWAIDLVIADLEQHDVI